MSGIIVGLVLRMPITEEFSTEAKFIATVYADHAWEDGTHAYPAVETVADIVGLHERTVQRYLRVLEKIGMLIPNGKGPRGTNKYDFPLQAGKDGSVRLVLVRGGAVPPLEETEKAADSGGIQPPWQPARGDTESGGADSGGAGVTQTNNPSSVVIVINAGEIFKTYESEIGLLTPTIRDSINSWLDDDKIPLEWMIDAMKIAATANARNWKYVEGILNNWRTKGRDAMKPQGVDHGNNGKGNSKRTAKPGLAEEHHPDYSDADREAAERVRKRKSEMPAV